MNVFQIFVLAFMLASNPASALPQSSPNVVSKLQTRQAIPYSFEVYASTGSYLSSCQSSILSRVQTLTLFSLIDCTGTAHVASGDAEFQGQKGNFAAARNSIRILVLNGDFNIMLWQGFNQAGAIADEFFGGPIGQCVSLPAALSWQVEFDGE
jgi:hypothetical protein